jgi:long-chain fatty acid transport protein
VSPTLAFDIVDGLSIGAGLQAQYVDAELSNAIDFGSIAAGIPALAPIARPTQQDGKARVTGDDWGFGWTLGLLYQPWTGTRFGLSYRSHVRHELDGNARFNLDSEGVGQAIAGATGAFTNTGATAKLETPESLLFGVYHDIDEQWSVMANASWTRWSRVKELRVRFDNPDQPDSVTESDWTDTWFVAAGTTYRPTPSWAIRLGAAYDQSPVPNRTRTPRVPDSDRYWLSVGASYAWSDAMDFTFGYAHIFSPEGSVRLQSEQPGNGPRGNLSGDVDASVDIVSLQFRWAF